MRADARQLETVQHVGGLVLDHLERGDRPIELHAHLGVLHRERVRRFHRADELGAQRDVRVVDDALPHARLITGGTDRLRFARVEGQTSHLARDVPRRHELAGRRFDQEGADPLLGAGDDQRPVGGVTVEHDGLRAGQLPSPGLADGARAHARHRIAGADFFQRDRAARRPDASDAS